MQRIERKTNELSALIFGSEKNAVAGLTDSVKGSDFKIQKINDTLVSVTHKPSKQVLTLAQGDVMVINGTSFSVMSQDAFDAQYSVVGTKRKTTKSTDAKTEARASQDVKPSPNDTTVDDVVTPAGVDVAAP